MTAKNVLWHSVDTLRESVCACARVRERRIGERKRGVGEREGENI